MTEQPYLTHASSPEVAHILVEAGAEMDDQEEDNGWTPLTYAVYDGDTEAVRLLVGADIRVSLEDVTTALHIASGEAEREIVRLLLEAGADVNAEGWRYMTPLMVAAHNGNIAAVSLLLEYGANINARTLTDEDADYYGGSTALLDAVKSQNVEIARLLLEHSADVDAADDAGYTSLMWTALRAFGEEDTEALRSSLALVRLLLNWDVDVNRQNIHKDTALDIAVRGPFGEEDTDAWSEIALLLAQAGAVRGEPKPRFCYRVVTDEWEQDLPQG